MGSKAWPQGTWQPLLISQDYVINEAREDVSGLILREEGSWEPRRGAPILGGPVLRSSQDLRVGAMGPGVLQELGSAWPGGVGGSGLLQKWPCWAGFPAASSSDGL